MGLYVLRRLLGSIPVLIAASFLTFTFVAAASDPLAQLEQQRNVNFAAIERVKQEKHLNDLFVVRYGYWVQDAVTNRFGTTLLGDRPIWPELKRVLGNTLQLVFVAEPVDQDHPRRKPDAGERVGDRPAPGDHVRGQHRREREVQ